jgi:predicted DCC family thiol-disulfide oxidoreductase YuxK
MSLAGLTRQDCEAAAYVVLQNNQDIHVYRGAAAVNFALSTLHGRSRVGWRALSGLYRVPILHRLEDMVYSVIARNRHRIGLSGPACNIP